VIGRAIVTIVVTDIRIDTDTTAARHGANQVMPLVVIQGGMNVHSARRKHRHERRNFRLFVSKGDPVG
jgi:hypothetical protein